VLDFAWVVRGPRQHERRSEPVIARSEMPAAACLPRSSQARWTDAEAAECTVRFGRQYREGVRDRQRLRHDRGRDQRRRVADIAGGVAFALTQAAQGLTRSIPSSWKWRLFRVARAARLAFAMPAICMSRISAGLPVRRCSAAIVPALIAAD
jgi:hypothetical protein